MKNWFRLQDSASLKRLADVLVTAGGALLLTFALGVFVYDAGLLALTGVGDINLVLLAEAVLATIGGAALVQRKRIPPVARALLGGLARLLGFPVVYFRQRVFVGVYHLLHHRWASHFGLGVAVLLVAAGVALLNTNTQQIAAYDRAMIANAQQDWEQQNTLLDASLNGYERDRRQGPLATLLFPTPSAEVAALAHFHKANGFLQLPGKGKEAYIELCKSLIRNPGNRYIGLTPEDAARREDNARHTQRNIEKLMRSGQDGGAGRPNGKQGQGQPQQGKGKQPSRDPGKEPQPGNGRQPRDVL